MIQVTLDALSNFYSTYPFLFVLWAVAFTGVSLVTAIGAYVIVFHYKTLPQVR
jgi:hypothetical protein